MTKEQEGKKNEEAEKGGKKDGQTYPKATVAATTCVLEEIQSSKTELRTLLANPAW